MQESTFELQTPVLFLHTHAYMYIKPPVDDKKGIGGFKK